MDNNFQRFLPRLVVPFTKFIRFRMKSILLLDSDHTFCACVKLFLVEKGYSVMTLAKQPELINVFKIFSHYKCLIIDSSIKSFSFPLIKQIKKSYPKLVIIILSKHDRISDRLQAFSAGTDDFIKKPCSLFELEIRMQRLLELYSQKGSFKKAFFSDVLPQPFKKINFVLTPQFRLILRLLCDAKGGLVPYEVIEYKMGIEQRATLTVTIHRLNMLLKKSGINANIRGVYGRGYRLILY